MVENTQTVAVIGAGAAGLSAARHLRSQGSKVTVFEKGSKVGGLWVYDNDNGLSAAYKSLYINSEPRVTSYRDYPFPQGTRDFPSHWEVAKYLEDFAHNSGVYELIQFNSEVVSVRPTGRIACTGWDVAIKQDEQQHFDHVVIATGHQGVPRHPKFADNYEGDYLHSHSYRTPERFTGNRVLVVGVGNSGLDIAADICTVSPTIVAARSPVLIMPRMLFGVPSARVVGAVNKPFLPWPVQRLVLRTISRLVNGPMEKWGFRTPKSRTHPASNATFMAHVAYRKIDVRPGVRKVTGKEVHFEDGSSDTVDTIIAATGYEVSLPFLAPEVSPVTEESDRMDLYRRVVSLDWPGLYFIGFFNVSGGANISMMDVQSEWVARLVSGDAILPTKENMKAGMKKDNALIARRYPGSLRYGLELDPFIYRRQIARELRRGRNKGPKN